MEPGRRCVWGGGLPSHSGFQVFPYDPAKGPPLATVPALAPIGPWTFRTDNLSASAGHAFKDGNFHIRGQGLSGEEIATVKLGNGDRALIGSEILGDDSSVDAEVDLVFPLPVPGETADLIKGFCVEIRRPNDGSPMTGVEVTLDGEIINIPDGDLFEAPRKGDPSQLGSVVCQPDRGTFDPRNLNAEVIVETTMGSDIWQGTRKPCTRIDRIYDPRGADGSTQACLVGGRFQVNALWEDFQGNSGPAGVRNLDASLLGGPPDQALFEFVNTQDGYRNSLLVQLVNGCGVNGRWWVFAGAASNVDYTLTVTDTDTDASSSYSNQLGTPAEAILDTQVFATCP